MGKRKRPLTANQKRRGLIRSIKQIQEMRETARTPRHVGISRRKERFAAAMRGKPTRLEATLGTSLSLAINNKFVIYRQWVEAGYILDFYIRDLKLCFEADGPFHEPVSDQRRDSHLAKRGIRTIRFTERDLKNTDQVGHDITRVIEARLTELGRVTST